MGSFENRDTRQVDSLGFQTVEPIMSISRLFPWSAKVRI
jgi:hypothetical protein